jgi:hypothetical protein
MVWPLREWRFVVTCLLLSCFLLLGFAVARGRPDINLYMIESLDASESGPLAVMPSPGVSAATSSKDTAVDSLRVARFAGSVPDAMVGSGSAAPDIRSGDQGTAFEEGIELDESRGAKVDDWSAAAETVGQSSNSGASPILVPDLITVINEYDVQDWQTVKGIGPALASRIVEYRKLKGGFGSLDELLEVSGIGPAKLSQVEAHLRAQWGW